MGQKIEGVTFIRGTKKSKGPTPPTTLVMRNVHPNEVSANQGVIQAEHMLRGAQDVISGTVLFVEANLRAEGKRFYQANLNGVFKPESELTDEQLSSYEYERAQDLKVVMADAGAMGDIHGTMNPESKEFVISEERGLVIARRLPYELRVSGFDQHQPGGTDHYANAVLEIPAVCAETGNNNSLTAVTFAEETVYSILRATGNLRDGKQAETLKQTDLRVDSLYKPQNEFRFVRRFREFAPVHEGELIGYDGDREVLATGDRVLLFTSQMIVPAGEEAFLTAVQEA